MRSSSWFVRSLFGTTLVVLGLSLTGCADLGDAADDDQSPALSSTNGLSSVNGLSATNGLSSVNGLSLDNGLSSATGLSSTTGLMTTADGRTTISYIVRCALPAGHSLKKKDQKGVSYTFPGAIGLAPGWENGAATQEDRNWVSACLMAHINTTGTHVPIWLDASAPSIGWGRSTSYPIQEGTFLGDLFASPPVGRYCGGRGYGSNIVAGRIGDTGQTNEPYTVLHDATGTSTRCDDICWRDPSGDGYLSCGDVGNGKAITVWRQLTSAPDQSFESNLAGFALSSGSEPTTLALATDRALYGSHALKATIKANGTGSVVVSAPTPSTIQPGTTMTFFINVPTGTHWSYLQAFAMDGPAKNYRWSAAGYNQDGIIPGEWNSFVVPIPSDYSASGGQIGLAMNITGSDAITVYVDAVFLHS